YNTVDASLWFVHAVHELWLAKQARPPLREQVSEGMRSELPNPAMQPAPFAPNPHPDPPSQGRGRELPALIAACRAVIASYRRGADFNIRMDDDGLIMAGDEGSQLTWMDAKRDGSVFTPRHGKAVEINALWFNALHCLAEMIEDQGSREELFAL